MADVVGPQMMRVMCHESQIHEGGDVATSRRPLASHRRGSLLRCYSTIGNTSSPQPWSVSIARRCSILHTRYHGIASVSFPWAACHYSRVLPYVVVTLIQYCIYCAR